jgi:hypothetical protein
MTRDPAPRTWPSALVLLALLAGAFVLAAIVGDGDHGKASTVKTVTLGGPTVRVPGQKPEHTLALDKTGQKIVAKAKADDLRDAKNGAEADLHEDLLPTGGALKQAEQITPPGQPEVPEQVPLAAASQPGCVTSFVRNYSDRPHGAPVLEGFIHWTGSSPTIGPQGGRAIVRWFDTPAAQASSNYITDQAGRCWYVVPETKKAWTQAGANPWAVSVEIVNAGVQPLFQTKAARDAVVKLMIGWHHRWHLPYRHGVVNQSTCVPIRSGYLSHRDGGPCAGGHPDVGSFDLDGLIREAAAKDPTNRHVTSVDRTTCRKLNWWRAHGRPHGAPERNAVRRRNALASATSRAPRAARSSRSRGGGDGDEGAVVRARPRGRRRRPARGGRRRRGAGHPHRLA